MPAYVIVAAIAFAAKIRNIIEERRLLDRL